MSDPYSTIPVPQVPSIIEGQNTSWREVQRLSVPITLWWRDDPQGLSLMPAWAAWPTEVEVDLAPSQRPPPRCTALYLLYESHLGWSWVRPAESNRALPPLSISASTIILKVSTENPTDLPVDTQLKGASLTATSNTRLIRRSFSMCLYKLVLSSPHFNAYYHLQTCCFSMLLPKLSGVASACSMLSNFCLSIENHPLL